MVDNTVNSVVNLCLFWVAIYTSGSERGLQVNFLHRSPVLGDELLEVCDPFYGRGSTFPLSLFLKDGVP